jgi:hypothetical protein
MKGERQVKEFSELSKGEVTEFTFDDPQFQDHDLQQVLYLAENLDMAKQFTLYIL